MSVMEKANNGPSHATRCSLTTVILSTSHICLLFIIVVVVVLVEVVVEEVVLVVVGGLQSGVVRLMMLAAEESRLASLRRRAQQLTAVQRRIREGLNQSAAQKKLLQLITREEEAAARGDQPRASDFRSVLRFGDHICATLFAPQSWRPPPPLRSGEESSWSWQPPARLVGGFPPAPQPENMQKGRLGQCSITFSAQHTLSSRVSPPAEDIEISNNIEPMEVVEESEGKEKEEGDVDVSNEISLGNQGKGVKRPRSPTPPPRIKNEIVRIAEEGSSLVSKVEDNLRPDPHMSEPVDKKTGTASANKKSRAISINFGFESDSDEESDEN